MDERYRWNDQRRNEHRSHDRDELERRAGAGWRGEDYGRYPGDRGYDRHEGRSDFERKAEDAGRWVRDKLDMGDHRERAESYQPNRAWEGRGEPYPKDLGGINRPGQEDRLTRDPLQGRGRDERGFRGHEERSYDYGARNHSGQGYSQNRYGEVPTYGQNRYAGDQGGRQQRDYSHQAYGRDGMNRYVEGGYETRPEHGEDHRGRYDRDRDDHDRSWWRKARDEFNAWMGDDAAEERRRRDHYHTREEPGRSEYGSQTRDDIRSRDDDTAWRDPMQAGRRDWRTNHGWNEEGRRGERHEPRDHRPGWFRDDRGSGRPW